MREKKLRYEVVPIETERDLRKNIRKISTRFNENPELARLVLVNPILALEDVGVELSAEVKRHVMDSLRFPPRLRERLSKLEGELKGELKKWGECDELPLTSERRASLLFKVLKVVPLKPDSKQTQVLKTSRTRIYRKQHEFINKLAEYERLRQGGLIFHTRNTYEEYRSGVKRHHWIKSVRF